MSPSASTIGLPLLRDSISAKWSACDLSVSARRKRMRPRSCGETFRHGPSNARRAADTARSTRWMLAGLFVIAALAWLPGRASAETIYADLDRDGRSDIITIQTVPTPGLRVWLSGSNSSLLLPTRRPITHVTASDIDGDG